MPDRKLLKYFDKTIMVIACIIFVIGLMTIYSATQSRELPPGESFVLRQAHSMAIALILLVIMLRFSYQRYIDLGYLIYATNIFLLIMVLITGHIRLGAQRWFSIGGFAFQPSEFIKVTLILAMAHYIGSKKDSMKEIGSLIVPTILMAIPFVLVVLQPDLGTALLLIPVFFAMLMIGGARTRYLAGMFAAGLASLPIFWHFLRDYQKQRLLVFINPNADPLGAGYTIIQSKIAIGSGGLWGKGWLAGTQNQLNFLPERHTDFIFSIIGEEWGFLGAIALILLYYLLIRRIFNIAASTSDIYGRLIAIGVAVMFSFQVTINIAMTVGLMPVVGIPLIFVSYGGSSLIATMAAIALVLNVGMRRSTF